MRSFYGVFRAKTNSELTHHTLTKIHNFVYFHPSEDKTVHHSVVIIFTLVNGGRKLIANTVRADFSLHKDTGVMMYNVVVIFSEVNHIPVFLVSVNHC